MADGKKRWKTRRDESHVVRIGKRVRDSVQRLVNRIVATGFRASEKPHIRKQLLEENREREREWEREGAQAA